MGTLSPSFRRPNIVPIGAAHETVISAIQSHDNSITDLNQAIATQAGQIAALKSPSSTTTSGSTSTTTQVSTENVTEVTTDIFSVNNQTGNTSYVTASSDNGAIIVFDDASAVAVTMNNGLTLPWGCFILNLGVGLVTLTPQQGQINNASTFAIAQGQFTSIAFDGMNYWAEPISAAGVTQIIAGTNITISPAGGTGAVTVNATSSGVTQIVAGSGISVSPVGGTGVVTVTASGGGSYSLGGSLTTGNVTLGSGAGSGATVNSVSGLDGNHQISITTGSSPTAGGTVFTVTFTTSRGHVTYPIMQILAVSVGGSYINLDPSVSSATAYSAASYPSAGLAASTTYIWNTSCP